MPHFEGVAPQAIQHFAQRVRPMLNVEYLQGFIYDKIKNDKFPDS